MKKALIVLMLVVLVASLAMFVACDNATAPKANFDVPAGGYDGSEVTIKFYHTMSATTLQPILEKHIKEFNKLYPNIHIEHSQIGNYDAVKDQITTELSAGNQPNIAYCYPDHIATYNMAGAVVQLDNLISSTEVVTRADGTTETLGLTQAQKDDFIEGFYNEGKQFGDDFMYSLPMSKSTEVLYYNKTFFTEHNIPVPTHWWCTESCPANCKSSLEKVCAAIKKEDPKSIPLGYDSEANWFITMCEQLGSPYTSAEEGNHFLFDNDTNKSFLKRFRDWYGKGYVTTQTIYGAYTSGLFVDTTAKNRNYMSIGSSAGANHQCPTPDEVEKKDENGQVVVDENGNAIIETVYPFEVGIVPIPQINSSKPRVISQGPNLCIFNKGNAQEVVASWLFVKYLTTTVTFQAEFGQASGYVPVLKSVASNEVYSKFMGKADGNKYLAALSAKVCLQQESAYYTSPAFNGSSTARTEVNDLLVKCISYTGTDVDAFFNQAFKDAIDECEYQL